VHISGRRGNGVDGDRDGAVQPTAPSHGVVRGVDDRIDVLLGDVAEDSGDAWHDCSMRAMCGDVALDHRT
jgi:hypothetical protein